MKKNIPLPSIRLHKKHIPIHPRRQLSSQEEYNLHIQTLLFLKRQIDLGFNPEWFITIHFKHPSERYRHQKETNKLFGWGDRYGMKNNKSLTGDTALYNHYHRRRNDPDEVEKDTGNIRKSIANRVYGIKRLDHIDKYPNMIFFHEKGRAKLQYHLHILLPKINSNNNAYHIIHSTKKSLETEFNTSIRDRNKCISSWKKIQVDTVSDPDGVIGYLNKETHFNHYSVDYTNSIFIKEKS